MEFLEAYEELTSLNESKADINAFINKFGQETYDNFIKAKDRLKAKNISNDLVWHTKHTSIEEMKNLLLSLYNKTDKSGNDIDAQKRRQLSNETRNIRGNYKFLGQHGNYLVYQPLDYISSMDLGINTGWCTTGRYGHAFKPNFTPAAGEAKKHFNDYTEQGIKLYYFLNPETFYGEYAIALYPKVINYENFGEKVFDEENKKVIQIKKVNFELFNTADVNIYYQPEIVSIAKEVGIDLVLDYVDTSETVDEYGVSIVGNKLMFCYNTKLKHYNIPETVEIIMENAFARTDLEEIEIPDTVRDIRNGAFGDCAKLSKVKLPKNIGYLPEGCFYLCNSLTEIYLPESLKILGRYCFGDCENLKFINTNNVEEIGLKCFINDSKLDTIDLSAATLVGLESFENGAIKTLIIGDNINSFGSESFRYTIIKKVIINDFNNYCLAKLEDTTSCPIKFCGNLVINGKKVSDTFEIPNDVSIIKPYTNAELHLNIRKLILPESTKMVGRSAFENCSGLEEIEFKNPEIIFYSDSFKYCKKINKVIVNCDLKDLSNRFKTIGYDAFKNVHSIECNDGNYSLDD